MIRLLQALRIPRSLQSQLILSVWLGMTAVILPFNIASIRHDAHTALEKEEIRLEDQGQIARSIVSRWTKSITKLMQVVALSPSVRSMDPQSSQQLFNQLKVLYPTRAWRLFTRSGDLISGTNISRPIAAQQAQQQPFFQDALKGESRFSVVAQCLTDDPCYLISAPVYRLGNHIFETPSEQPVGVLVIAIRLKDTAMDSGMKSEVSTIYTGQAGTDLPSGIPPTLSLDRGLRTGAEILMVSRNGNVVFPLSTINDSVSMQTSTQRLRGPWGPIIRAGMDVAPNGSFTEVRAAGAAFNVFAQPADANWSVVAVSDRETTLSSVYAAARQQLLRQILFLLLVSLVIVVVCRHAAKPIRRAAATLKEFSKGNFAARIEVTRDDEVGDLFNSINETGASLVELLNARLEHAVTDKQLETATEIQKQFIIQNKLSSEHVQIAADFDPAYEIGADWYDVLHADGVTFVVMADVCDKGIPSALFMSVFRSLLRYSLDHDHRQQSSEAIQSCLLDTVVRVNHYMADNHGDAVMFATVFIAAYEHNTEQLHYINAGHEVPFIMRSDGALDALAATGPAVGIFKGVSYTVKSAPLRQGEILVTYTDGLVDARSPEQTAFGVNRVKALLNTVRCQDCDVAQLLDLLLQEVRHHAQDTEQFDDMTILVMKAGAA